MIVVDWLKSVAIFLLTEEFAATDMVVVRSVLQKSHRHPFTMCLPTNPCHTLSRGCTHGHLLEARFGGLAHCRNCLPQDNRQQALHTEAFDVCMNENKMLRMRAYANNTEACGYTFHYECIGVWTLVRLVVTEWLGPNTRLPNLWNYLQNESNLLQSHLPRWPLSASTAWWMGPW